MKTLHGEPARYAQGVTRVADGTFAWLQPNGGWGESNAGLIVGEGASLAVDTLWDLTLTARMLAAYAPLTAAHPITTLVCTHGDGDHVYGNQLLPGATLVTSIAAGPEIADEHPEALRRFQRLTGVGRFVPRWPLPGYVHGMLAPFDFAGITVRSPDRTFVDRLALDIGGREVIVRHAGPGHTRSDTIVHVPDVATVFAGDLAFIGVTPNAWAGPISSWRTGLRTIIDLRPEQVVPGHGPVSTVAELDVLDEYFEWLQRTAPPLLGQERSAEQVALRLIAEATAHDRPWASWDLPERTLPNLIVLDRELRGRPTAITHAERPKLMRRMASLAAALAREVR